MDSSQELDSNVHQGGLDLLIKVNWDKTELHLISFNLRVLSCSFIIIIIIIIIIAQLTYLTSHNCLEESWI